MCVDVSGSSGLAGIRTKSAFVVASTQTITLMLFGSVGTATLLYYLAVLIFAQRCKKSER
jgi:hypothetical protein